VYISQLSSSYEYEYCNGPSETISIPTSHFDSGMTAQFVLGPGLSGYVGEAYPIDHHSSASVFKLFKGSQGDQKYYCFESEYHNDPNYLDGG